MVPMLATHLPYRGHPYRRYCPTNVGALITASADDHDPASSIRFFR
jgi:hypothetical protein